MLTFEKTRGVRERAASASAAEEKGVVGGVGVVDIMVESEQYNIAIEVDCAGQQWHNNFPVARQVAWSVT